MRLGRWLTFATWEVNVAGSVYHGGELARYCCEGWLLVAASSVHSLTVQQQGTVKYRWMRCRATGPCWMLDVG